MHQRMISEPDARRLQPQLPLDTAALDLAPLLEGARARGVFDAFELCGQAAVLLGGDGEVLHATSRAHELLGGALRISGNCLIAESFEANRILSCAIGAALNGAESTESEGIIAAGAVRIRLRAKRFEGGAGNFAQLLKAVLLLDPA